MKSWHTWAIAGIAAGSVVSSQPSSLLEARRKLSPDEIQRREFLPCVKSYNVSTSPFQRIATFGYGSGKEQIPFVSPAENQTEVYWEEAQSDNLAYHYHPEAIVYPRDAAQVSHVVTCASRYGNIAVAARSGGHSFSGYGSGGQDGSVIVDLKHLASIEPNPRQGLVDVGPGARLGDVVKSLWDNGKRAMPHGTCAAVGMGGHAICGGFGPSSRKWGMTMDNIVEADVVLADGSIVTASNQANQELFWALRGAGHFFGIVTRFRFATHDASKPMGFIEYKWTRSLKGPNDLVKLTQAVQKWTADPDFPSDIGFHVQLGPATTLDTQAGWDPEVPQFTFHIRGMHLAPLAGYKKWSNKLYAALKQVGAPSPDHTAEDEVNWLKLQQMWDDFGAPDDKLDTAAEHMIRNKYVAKTVLSSDHRKPLSTAALQESMGFLWDSMQRTFASQQRSFWNWNVYMEMFGGSNARYRDDPQLVRTSSFPHRDALWLVQASVGTSAAGTLDASAHKLVGDIEKVFIKTVKDSGSEPVSYGCYTDGDKTRDGSWKALYYGDSVSRLEQLKHKLDPSNLFRNPQTFGPAPEYIKQHTSSDGTDHKPYVKISHPLP